MMDFATTQSPVMPLDPALPGLSVALNPLLMQAVFQDLLFGPSHSALGQPEVISCGIGRVKYRAGEKCVISYRLQLVEPTTGAHDEAWFCARVFPAESAASRYTKALAEPRTPPRYGDAVMWVPHLAMVVWAFPNDRKIGGLPALMRMAERRDDRLAQLVAATWGAGTRIIGHQSRLIHYVPEHTCTVRVQLDLANPAPAAPVLATVTLFGKAYYDEQGAESYRLMQLLWASAASRQGRLRIAQPLAYDPAQRLLWQLGLPGRTLLSYGLPLAGHEECTRTARLAEAAGAVAWLHRSALPCRHVTTQAALLGLLVSRQRLVKQQLPSLALPVARLVRRLVATPPVAQNEPQATLHGDLHLQNFLVDEAAPTGQQVALIDLDNLTTGSPWHDLGSFCAALYYRGLIDGIAPSQIDQVIEQCLAAYADQAPWSLDRAAIRWYTAVALLNERVFRSLTRLKEGRLALIEQLIELAAVKSVV